MILLLQYFKDNKIKLFIIGALIGSIIEYCVSLYGDIVLNVKWWDYSNLPFNINGRICLLFSLLWGALAVVFISYIHPLIEKFFMHLKKKISEKELKFLITIITLFLLFDFIISTYAVNVFIIRKTHEFNFEIEDKIKSEMQYNRIYNNEKLSKFILNHFSDEKIIKAFPHLKLNDANGNVIHLNEYINDVKPYYYKFER